MAEQIDVMNIQAAIKDADAGWQASANFLTTLTDDERTLYLGYEPGPGEPSLAQREELALAHAQAFAAGVRMRGVGAPASYDLRNVGGNNFITPVKDQGSCGSCVAFGAVAAVEGTARVAANNANLSIDLSEAHLFYCHARAQGRNCGNGWWVDPALDCFKNPGVADEACYPYTAGDQNCSNLCSDWQNRVKRISGWRKITAAVDMKTWLSSRGPLATCMTVYNDFFSYRSGVYRHVSGGVAGGHCICCVGYDDAQGYWICKNSWSAGWGENGFFRIAYGQCGIDGEMWAVDGLLDIGWLNNVRIVGLWTIDQDRNAWVYVRDAAGNNIGWKRIAADNDNIFYAILTDLIAAKAAARPVNLSIDNGVIKQLYVL